MSEYRDLPGLVRRLVDDYLAASKENDELKAERDALRKELAELKDGLTTAYMAGYEKGRDELRQLVNACNALKSDLIERADASLHENQRVVDVSRGVWDQFKAALSRAEEA